MSWCYPKKGIIFLAYFKNNVTDYKLNAFIPAPMHSVPFQLYIPYPFQINFWYPRAPLKKTWPLYKSLHITKEHPFIFVFFSDEEKALEYVNTQGVRFKTQDPILDSLEGKLIKFSSINTYLFLKGSYVICTLVFSSDNFKCPLFTDKNVKLS